MLSKSLALLAIKNMNVQSLLAKNITTTASVLNVDPVQQVFVDKIREYYKLKSSGKGLQTPESVKALNDELEKITRQYGAQGQKFDEFPAFKFEEPKLESPNQA